MRSQQNPKVKRSGTMADFDSLHSDRICKHYVHAREKHPYFCDEIAPLNWSTKDQKRIELSLSSVRARISKAIKRNNLGWDDILDCEIWEVLSAIANGEVINSIEECYDAIAVLLRTIDVLEGRQKLGRPETEGGAK